MVVKFLVFGDIMAKLGRRAVAATLPELKAKYNPDLVIGNVENLAHGTGITENTIEEVRNAGIDVFTSGNHIWDNENLKPLTQDKKIVVLRPANYSDANPGIGWRLINLRGADGQTADGQNAKILIINLQGRVFMKDLLENPFLMFDKILASKDAQGADIVLVDFHAEATSEKVAMCLHADGRAAAVWGTHAHVPTADARLSALGTAMITDVGMTGFKDGVIGFDKNAALTGYKRGILSKAPLPEEGAAQVNALYIEVDKETGKAVKLEQIQLTKNI